MSLPVNLRAVAGAVSAAAGLIAVGAAAGVVAERSVVGRTPRADSESEEPFGRLRSAPIVVDSEGVKLHVEVEECVRANPEGLTVVFCHGYSLNQDCWHYQRRDLKALGRLVFWDQRSHGRSTRSVAETNTIEQLARDLYAVLEAVVPAGPVVLVGHSMGGMTIMQFALDHPEMLGSRVRGVALLSTSPGGLREVGLGLPDFAARPLHRLLPVTTAVLVRNADLVEMGRSRANDLSLLLTRRYSFGSSASPAVAEFTHRMLNDTSIGVISEFLPTLQAHDRHRSLKVLSKVPVLLMVGLDDRMTPAEHTREMASRMPDAELVLVPDSGHMMILEHYGRVNHQLRRLVAQVRDDLAIHPESTSAATRVTAELGSGADPGAGQ